MLSKTCTGPCGQTLSLDHFGRRKGAKGKIRIRERCKKCHTLLNMESRKKCGRKNSEKTVINARTRASDYYYKNRHTERFKANACALSNRRRAYKINATPPWLSKEHTSQIKEFYWLAKDLQMVSGETYHVDHIVPLKGENVCGLHVPWNLQVLPADINLSKGNSYADYA